MNPNALFVSHPSATTKIKTYVIKKKVASFFDRNNSIAVLSAVVYEAYHIIN